MEFLIATERFDASLVSVECGFFIVHILVKSIFWLIWCILILFSLPRIRKNNTFQYTKDENSPPPQGSAHFHTNKIISNLPTWHSSNTRLQRRSHKDSKHYKNWHHFCWAISLSSYIRDQWPSRSLTQQLGDYWVLEKGVFIIFFYHPCFVFVCAFFWHPWVYLKIILIWHPNWRLKSVHEISLW